MQPIKYYKDDRYDHDLYDYFDRTINGVDEDGDTLNGTFDPIGNGYNHLGYDTLTLINMVWCGEQKMKYYFLDEEGDMIHFDTEDFHFITWRGAYKTTPMTDQERQAVAEARHLLSLTIEDRNDILENKKTNHIGQFNFLRG
jgi:hypothetical protein